MSAEIYEQHAQINFYLANLLTGTVNEKVVGDIDLDKSDLFDIVKKEPLSNIIADANDNEITFKGQEPDELPTDQDDNTKTLKSMASKALKK